MWYAVFVRFIRSRLVLGIIFTCSLIYCILNLVGPFDLFNAADESPVRRTQPFIWKTPQEFNTSDGAVRCRNSIQGKELIVDDRGFVCPWNDILPNGCCNDNLSTSSQYTCQSCKSNNCCSIYEYCVSCCLHPDKKVMLENLLGKATQQNNVLFASVTDHFELCLSKCRTNSQSVQHENSYKDPKAKYCFGELPPGGGLNDNKN